MTSRDKRILPQKYEIDKRPLSWECGGEPISKGLVSLMEIIRFYAGTFGVVLSTLQTVEDILDYRITPCQREAVRKHNDRVSKDGFAYIDSMNILKEECEKLQLQASSTLIKHIIQGLDNITYGGLKQQLTTLRDIIDDELSERMIIFIPPNRSRYIDDETLFGQTVSTSFSSAIYDIKEAGNCFAIGLYTACVFHLMRVLEHGLKALAKDINLTFYRQSWGKIIDKIRDKVDGEIKLLCKQPKDPDRTERLTFLSHAAKEFVYFKDGWRNYAMHGLEEYDAPKALSVFNHVKTFMVHLSTRLTE